jgi:DNA-binding XRE family transcriptional regulator
MKKFDGSAFRAWRIDHDLTQEQAAELVGVTVHTIRSWEQGVRSPSRNIALLIERLRPDDYPQNAGSAGNRPVGISTQNRRKTT